MEIIFKIHSLVLLYTKKETIRIPQILMANMAVFIYIEKKTFFLLLELGNQCPMWILSSGSPKRLPKAHIQGMELEGNINSLCQVECSQESLHHGLIYQQHY